MLAYPEIPHVLLKIRQVVIERVSPHDNQHKTLAVVSCTMQETGLSKLGTSENTVCPAFRSVKVPLEVSNLILDCSLTLLLHVPGLLLEEWHVALVEFCTRFFQSVLKFGTPNACDGRHAY